MAMYLYDIFTIPANLAGVPAVTIPAEDDAGLPIGIQLTAPASWTRPTLFRAAHALEIGLDLGPAVRRPRGVSAVRPVGSAVWRAAGKP